MARYAIAAGRPTRELTFVHVLVAIGAFLVCHGLLEIGVLMALEAAGLGVFSVEREFGLVVIESRVGSHGFPGGCYVARLAGSLERRVHERAAMRIGMAVLTGGKAQTLVSRRSTTRRRRMALHAVDTLMPPCQGIRCTAVIEARSGFPGVLRMAVRALVAELSGVRILVATDTLRGQTKEGVVQILDLHLGPNGSHNMLRIVAILAGQGLVFADQRKICQGVMLEPRLVKFCYLE